MSRTNAEAGGLNQSQLGTYPSEGTQGEVQVVPGVAGRELAAHPGLPLRDHRVAESGDEHPLLEEQLAHADRLRRFAQDHRDDRGSARNRLEAEGREPLPEIAGVVMQPGDALGVRLQVAHGGKGTACDGGGEGVAEELGAGPLGRSEERRVGEECRWWWTTGE